MTNTKESKTINKDIEKLTKDGNVNKYSLVSAIAKRARVISEQTKVNHDVSYERPVSISFDELEEGKYTITAKDPGAEE